MHQHETKACTQTCTRLEHVHTRIQSKPGVKHPIKLAQMHRSRERGREKQRQRAIMQRGRDRYAQRGTDRQAETERAREYWMS